MNGEKTAPTALVTPKPPAATESSSSPSTALPPVPGFASLAARCLAGALSGALMFVCFPQLNWSWLVWIACLPLLVALVSERGLGRAFLLGYLSGAVFLAGSCYWFVSVMRTYGRMSSALALGVLLLFLIVSSSFFGAFGLVEAWAARRSAGRALALSPFLWVTMELGRTYLITGFPWNLLGYALPAEGLRQWAGVTGVYGLSFLAVATSAWLAWALIERRRKGVWLAGLGWVLLLAAGNGLSAPPALRSGASAALLVQPNVPLDEAGLDSWVPWRHPAQLERLVSMTLDGRYRLEDSIGGPPLIVWAENPAPFYFTRDPVFRGAMVRMARASRAYVVVNTVTFAGPENNRPRNSAILLGPDGRELFHYDKIHLVPFGEYVPWWAFPGKVGKITLEVGDFVPGSNYNVATTPGGKIGIFICYEAIFPQLVRRLAAAGAGVLVNISNDAWYGDSPAAAQHLAMARLRAVENARTLLRATNDGITVVIDPYGRVVDSAPRHREAVLAGRFDYLSGTTFYTAYGDVFAWLCVAGGAGLIAAPRRIRRRKKLER